MAELVVTCDVAAPREKVWAALVDWNLHERWMLFTRATGGAAVSEPIEAFTGIGRLGFLDTMTITVWEPPQRAVVRHTGRVVRGSGSFEVVETAPGCSRVVWSEWVDLPLGLLGRLGWPLFRPFLKAGVGFSLRRLANYVETQP
ncbi:MAG: SRPBCC family protein [Actinomycetes bacterium]